MKLKVYIASPYTKGDGGVNVKKQLEMFTLLSDAGFFPYAPLLTHFVHMHNPRPYRTWIEHDFIWVKTCDALIRLQGESAGADREIETAERYDIPVFREIDELYLWAKRTGWDYNETIPVDWVFSEYSRINNLDV